MDVPLFFGVIFDVMLEPELIIPLAVKDTTHGLEPQARRIFELYKPAVPMLPRPYLYPATAALSIIMGVDMSKKQQNSDKYRNIDPARPSYPDIFPSPPPAETDKIHPPHSPTLRDTNPHL